MWRTLRLLFLVAGLVAMTTTLPGEVPCCDLRYEVEPDPETGVVDVTLTLYGFTGDSLVLERPSSRPLVGLLSQDPEVEGVRRVRWDMVEGAPRWIFDRPEDGWDESIRIRYRLAITAERPLNAWSVGLDDDLLYAPAEALFLVPTIPEVAAAHAPIRVEWELPGDWDVFTGWEGSSFHGVRRLIRTNVLAGRIERYVASACDQTIELGVHGDWSEAPAELVEDLAALGCSARKRLGSPGVDRFAVALVEARFPMTSGNRNGPHAIGFVHRMPDGSPPSTRLLAHELVHLWQQFDAPLWFQEGVNDYLALRLAHEAGLLDEAAYGGAITAIDSIYRIHPQRRRWTFADEEREAPAFGPSDSYLAYRKGALVGLALDRELRLRTGGEMDVARLWREMNARASWGHVEWTVDEIATRAAALADGSVDRFFGRYVMGTEEMPGPGELLANLPPLPEPATESRGLGAVAAFLQARFE